MSSRFVSKSATMPGPPGCPRDGRSDDVGGCRYLQRGQRCFQGCRPGHFVCHHYVKHGVCDPNKCRRPGDREYHPRHATWQNNRRSSSQERPRTPPGGRTKPGSAHANGAHDSQGRSASSGNVPPPPPPPDDEAPPPRHRTTREEIRTALETLGLNPTGEHVTRALMLNAWKLRMPQCHPDKPGGNNPEAAACNHAKDVLDKVYPAE